MSKGASWLDLGVPQRSLRDPAPVAQRIERPASTRLVGGSNPSGRAVVGEMTFKDLPWARLTTVLTTVASSTTLRPACEHIRNGLGRLDGVRVVEMCVQVARGRKPAVAQDLGQRSHADF